MTLVTEPYSEQVNVWPKEGRHILAQYDDNTIIVYQAYHPSIGHYAAEHGTFGGDFSYSRMSWTARPKMPNLGRSILDTQTIGMLKWGGIWRAAELSRAVPGWSALARSNKKFG